MWYVYEIIGNDEELRGRYDTKPEADAYADELTVRAGRECFIVRPSDEEAARIRDEQQRRTQRPGRGYP
jgi:hypothetical protein